MESWIDQSHGHVVVTGTGMEAAGVVRELQATLFPVCAKGQVRVQLEMFSGLVMQLSVLGLPLFKQSSNRCSLLTTVPVFFLFCLHHVKK